MAADPSEVKISDCPAWDGAGFLELKPVSGDGRKIRDDLEIAVFPRVDGKLAKPEAGT
jgi:hypothetical protein